MSLCVTVLLVLTAAVVGNSEWGAAEKEASVPLPTEDVLAWTKREIGAFFSFNMITMVTNITQNLCPGSGSAIPSPDTFNPDKLDMDNWLQAAVAFGAKYAILTAKHCSGFSMWPSDIYQETGFNYTYSTKYSSFQGGSYDVVKDFINSCAKYGVEPGIYYSLNDNYYLNARRGIVQNTSLVPGQAKVSQEMYGKIVLAQMRELWSNYGKLSEIWFDGGFSVPGITNEILSMLTDLQPQAVYFNGVANENNIRWVGTESGEPGYPIWSTAVNCASGLGDPNGNVFCPAETDTTLQDFDQWFWRPDFPIRNLSVLQQVYYHSVGQNTNLLLNTPANKSGLIEDSYFARYKEFGDWIQMCFGSSVVETSGTGLYLKLSLPSGKPFQFNKVVLSEDQSHGEAVLDFTISALLSNGTIATILTGQSVGNKFVRDVGSTLSAVEVVVNVMKAFYEPVFAVFSVHNC